MSNYRLLRHPIDRYLDARELHSCFRRGFLQCGTNFIAVISEATYRSIDNLCPQELHLTKKACLAGQVVSRTISRSLDCLRWCEKVAASAEISQQASSLQLQAPSPCFDAEVPLVIRSVPSHFFCCC